jgi:hypothetical protein
MSRAIGSVIAIPKRQRCAIYTRKSSEEGLDMEFNSLDAQREACEAYVASQRAEGWAAIRERYDDGGFSGGTLDRPGLKQLVADVGAGLIDVIVVYKIDRLSRSLMDFAKLVEIFERNNVTFVSVTQSFNTTTSMGRLTQDECYICCSVSGKSDSSSGSHWFIDSAIHSETSSAADTNAVSRWWIYRLVVLLLEWPIMAAMVGSVYPRSEATDAYA